MDAGVQTRILDASKSELSILWSYTLHNYVGLTFSLFRDCRSDFDP